MLSKGYHWTDPHHRHRRVGACVLLAVQERPPRLCQSILECRQLGGCDGAICISLDKSESEKLVFIYFFDFERTEPNPVLLLHHPSLSQPCENDTNERGSS